MFSHNRLGRNINFIRHWIEKNLNEIVAAELLLKQYKKPKCFFTFYLNINQYIYLYLSVLFMTFLRK